ncbi:MAG TPA: hypothetical protein VGF48_17140 [Thermoanaerobaculia bacterium]
MREAIDWIGEAIDWISEAIDSMRDAIDWISDAIDSMRDAIDWIGEAIGSMRDAIDWIGEAIDWMRDAIDCIREAIDDSDGAIDCIRVDTAVGGRPPYCHPERSEGPPPHMRIRPVHSLMGRGSFASLRMTAGGEGAPSLRSGRHGGTPSPPSPCR